MADLKNAAPAYEPIWRMGGETVYLDSFAGPADPRGAWSWVTLKVERPGQKSEYVTLARASSAAAETLVRPRRLGWLRRAVRRYFEADLSEATRP